MAKQESSESGILKDSILLEKRPQEIWVSTPDSSCDYFPSVVHMLREHYSVQLLSPTRAEITPPEGSDIDELWDQISERMTETLQALNINPPVTEE